MTLHAVAPLPPCRGGCGVPLDDFLVEPDGRGLHPTCKALIEPVLPTLQAILNRHQNGPGTRSAQVHIGPSQIGVECDRALAYRVFGVPKVNDEGLKWAPLLGTWAHAGIAEALHEENKALGRERYLIERRLTVSSALDIGGQCDVYDIDTDEVIDWKLIGMTAMKGYKAHGPGETYRTQAHLYGLGWRNAGYSPRSVRVVFLPKWSITIMDGIEWCEPFRPDIAEAALRRLQRVTYLGTAVAVTQEPRNFALIPSNPGDPCTFCEWRRAGGPADETGCPGNTAEVMASATSKFNDGLI